MLSKIWLIAAHPAAALGMFSAYGQAKLKVAAYAASLVQ